MTVLLKVVLVNMNISLVSKMPSPKQKREEKEKVEKIEEDQIKKYLKESDILREM